LPHLPFARWPPAQVSLFPVTRGRNELAEGFTPNYHARV
jgi:hypothetical protein